MVVLAGRNLLRPGVRFYARCGNRSYELRLLTPQPDAAAATAADALVQSGAVEAASAAIPPPRPPMELNSPDVRRGSGPTGDTASLATWSGAGGDEDGSGPYESEGYPSSWASPTSVRTPERPSCTSAAVFPTAAAATAEPSDGVSTLPPPAAASAAAAGAGTALAFAGMVAQEPDLESVWLYVPPLMQHGLLAVEAVSPDVGVMGAWTAGVACKDTATTAELNAWLHCGTNHSG